MLLFKKKITFFGILVHLDILLSLKIIIFSNSAKKKYQHVKLAIFVLVIQTRRIHTLSNMEILTPSQYYYYPKKKFFFSKQHTCNKSRICSKIIHCALATHEGSVFFQGESVHNWRQYISIVLVHNGQICLLSINFYKMKFIV